ncbi:radical SAM family heme chaperone HemW [Tenacibaculum sp. UWU-22]|uniref:radical SAM family heme chaperone HemW n=1 Tax=Tenacibaculum sp. UWU-22 TaxID=3234187 RepID=UPI0034DB4D56
MAGIYLHIPFCKQACFYCDFHFSTSLKKKEILVACLVKELELRKNELATETIETIYFGGGTPSLLTIEEIDLLIDTIYKNYRVINNPEISLEANPDDLSDEKIKTLALSPINRISIGIQSFFKEDLQFMNRAHSAKEALKCLSTTSAFFNNITIDLIYGLPNMTNEQWQKNLHTAFNFNVNHISSYALTVEPKTALETFIKQKKYPSLDEKIAKQHFDILVDETTKNGFIQYEISNFGKPNYFSKHNSSYWLGKKYMGVGPSAHSFNKIERSWNIANNPKYIKEILANKLPKQEEKLTKKDRYNEYIMTGLRTIWGVSLNKIKQEFGPDFYKYIIASSKKDINQNLLIIENDSLKTTQKGKFLADGLASNLFLI